MTDFNPITPPPELVQQWTHEWNTLGARHPAATNTASYVAALAAQWGADQELEACCEVFRRAQWDNLSCDLRARRRPKPPSLKEQALASAGGPRKPSTANNQPSTTQAAKKPEFPPPRVIREDFLPGKQTPWDAEQLRTARRPKPPNLKEQALSALHRIADGDGDILEQHQGLDIIRQALEQLND